MLLILLLYLVLGAAAGVVAGLFGIGGGLLIVPVLIFTFGLQGMSTEVLTHVAVATSLATIVVTSISSVLAHQKRGAVRWDIFRPLVLGIVLGAVLGAITADYMQGAHLQVAIGIFALVISIQMAFGLKPDSGATADLSGKTLSVAGSVVGYASAIFGIGGGSLTVPYLTWKGVRMQETVATSAACGLPIAVVGALTNVVVGWGEADLPDWSLGYVYLPAFLGIVVSSSFFAKVGARLAHSLPADLLRKIFAAFLMLVALRFLLSNLL